MRKVRIAPLAVAVLLCMAGARAENRIAIGSAEAEPGARTVPVIVTAVNDVAVHGYSIALSFPPEALRMTELGVDGTHVHALEPAFVGPRIDNELGVASLGVILELDELTGVALPPSVDQPAPIIIARLVFDVRLDAPGGEYPLRLVDGVGTPAAFNRFTDSGTSIRPSLTSGTFRVLGGNVLEVEKTRAIPGSTSFLSVTALASHPEPLEGFSIALAFDCGDDPASPIVSLERAERTGTDLEFFLRGGIEVFESDIDDSFRPKCRSRTAAVFDFFEPFEGQSLPASGDRPQSLMRYTFRVSPRASAEREFQDLILEELDLPGAITNTFLINSASLTPRLIHGKIFFSLGNLEGRVVEALSGDPVRGALVVTDPDGSQARTGADGRFRIEDVIPGAYAVTIAGTEHYAARHEGLEVAGRGETSDAGDLVVYRIPSGAPPGGGITFVRGNANIDGRVDLSDPFSIHNWLFRGERPPVCRQAADINDDNRNDISDSVWMLNWLFLGGPAIGPPYPDCGLDPDSSDLPCEETSNCP